MSGVRRSYELLITRADGTRATVVWDGADAVQACESYAAAHPGHAVVAWRSHPRTGLMIGGIERIQP